MVGDLDPADYLPIQEAMMERVRAGIAAMREPTTEMTKAVLDAGSSEYVEEGTVYDEYDSDRARLEPDAPQRIWEAMIDAALADPPADGVQDAIRDLGHHGPKARDRK